MLQMRAEPFGPLVVFTLANEKWALPASVVQRAVRAVEITPCPDAPDVVLGVINVHGRIIPVFDLRRRFGLPLRELSIDDHIIIANAQRGNPGRCSVRNDAAGRIRGSYKDGTSAGAHDL